MNGCYYERKELKMENHYEALGLNMNATQEAIKAAYRDIVKENHPDINPSPEAKEKVQKANKAYAILGDVKLREEYDEMFKATLKYIVNDMFSELDEAFTKYENAIDEKFDYYNQRTEETSEFLKQLREELDEMDDEDLFQESEPVSRKKKRFFWKR